MHLIIDAKADGFPHYELKFMYIPAAPGKLASSTSPKNSILEGPGMLTSSKLLGGALFLTYERVKDLTSSM
jgi:hypothetical protein